MPKQSTRKCAVKVKFKRDEHAKWEYGIAVGDDPCDVDIILNSHGNVETSAIWDFKPLLEDGLIWFDKLGVVQEARTLQSDLHEDR